MELNEHLPQCLEGMIIFNYDLQKEKNLNFLIDYSCYLFKIKKYDNTILNWQAENSAILKPMGLDYIFLKKRLEEKNKLYYKYDSLLNQISYRLEKHGRLAPTKEIGKKYNQMELENYDNKEIDENADTNLLNPNEINFYDLNDPFICDDEAFSDDSQNEFFDLTLPYGNYSEDAVIKNLLRSKKLKRKSKIIKKVQNEKFENKLNIQTTNNFSTGINFTSSTQNEKNSRSNLEIESNLDENVIMNSPSNKIDKNVKNSTNIKIKNKKRKLNEIDENLILPCTPTKNSKVFLTNSDKKESEENIDFQEDVDNEIKNYFTSQDKESLKDPKEKVNFIKKMVIHFKKIQNESQSNNYKYFFGKISEVLIHDESTLKFVIEFEILKTKREGIFSHLAKLINKFITMLTDNNVRNIPDCETIKENEEILEKFLTLLSKIDDYLDFIKNIYEKDIIQKIEKFNNITKNGAITPKDGKEKVILKFTELLTKQQVIFNEESLLNLLKFKNDSPFNDYPNNNSLNSILEDAEIIKNNLIVNESEFKNLGIGSKIKKNKPNVEKKIKTKKSSKNKKDKITNKSENDNSNSNLQNSFVNIHNENKVSLQLENFLSENKSQSNENNIEIQPKVPIMTKRFYVKEFDEEDFTNSNYTSLLKNLLPK